MFYSFLNLIHALLEKRRAWVAYQVVRENLMEEVTAVWPREGDPRIVELWDASRAAYREYERAADVPWRLTGYRLFGKYRTA